MRVVIATLLTWLTGESPAALDFDFDFALDGRKSTAQGSKEVKTLGREEEANVMNCREVALGHEERCQAKSYLSRKPGNARP